MTCATWPQQPSPLRTWAASQRSLSIWHPAVEHVEPSHSKSTTVLKHTSYLYVEHLATFQPPTTLHCYNMILMLFSSTHLVCVSYLPPPLPPPLATLPRGGPWSIPAPAAKRYQHLSAWSAWSAPTALRWTSRTPTSTPVDAWRQSAPPWGAQPRQGCWSPADGGDEGVITWHHFTEQNLWPINFCLY